MVFPNAQVRDRVEFYGETTEGFLNKYMQDQMFCHEPTDVESFGARAVNIVHIERRWIRIGDSDTRGLDGLILVTRPIWEGLWKRRRDMGGGRSLPSEEQTESDSKGEDNNRFLEERSQLKRNCRQFRFFRDKFL